jgi:antitoxin ParD1/3/4
LVLTERVLTMAKNTSVTLGDHFDQFISQQLHSGRYGSASEVIRAGLRALEDQEVKILNLRDMLIQGEQSGTVDYNYDSLLSELDKDNH